MIGGEDGETEDPNKSVHHLVVSFLSDNSDRLCKTIVVNFFI